MDSNYNKYANDSQRNMQSGLFHSTQWLQKRDVNEKTILISSVHPLSN